ncbi:galactokinase [Flavobacteriaceae bacterium]|nr:galactokinase [Flavobacteriaceae bacterium]
MSKKLKKKVEKNFKEHFKGKPILVFSPGRINLIGEHTDYNEGFVFPAAINKGIVLAIQKSDLGHSKVYALNKEEMHEFNLQNIVPIENGGWRNYVLGVVAEIKKLGITLTNFNISFAGNIPDGAGMSSSSALENSVVYGLNEVFNLSLSKHKMILISQKAEHNFAGVKCGIMDQYASMFGEKGSALLLDCRTVESQSYKINLKNHKLLLINTNVKHNLSQSAYNDRRKVCENVSKKLNISALRDASIEDLQKIRGSILEENFNKALYIIEENERVKSFSKAIENVNVDTLGELLYQSHQGLSTLYKVSCKELDFLVEKTRESSNILGARMMGGGFGGCTINLVHKDFKNEIKKIAKEYQLEFKIEPSVYRIKLSDGVKTLKNEE